MQAPLQMGFLPRGAQRLQRKVQVHPRASPRGSLRSPGSISGSGSPGEKWAEYFRPHYPQHHSQLAGNSRGAGAGVGVSGCPQGPGARFRTSRALNAFATGGAKLGLMVPEADVILLIAESFGVVFFF